MVIYKIDKDIKVFCVKASSFPEGIQEAYRKLNSIAPASAERRYFGLSRMEIGEINYWAAAEEIEPGKSEKFGCESIVIKSGNYIGKLVPNFMNDIPEIGKTFQELIKEPDIDPDGYCVELYLNDKDVQCMVRLIH